MIISPHAAVDMVTSCPARTRSCHLSDSNHSSPHTSLARVSVDWYPRIRAAHGCQRGSNRPAPSRREPRRKRRGRLIRHGVSPKPPHHSDHACHANVQKAMELFPDGAQRASSEPRDQRVTSTPTRTGRASRCARASLNAAAWRMQRAGRATAALPTTSCSRGPPSRATTTPRGRHVENHRGGGRTGATTSSCATSPTACTAPTVYAASAAPASPSMSTETAAG